MNNEKRIALQNIDTSFLGLAMNQLTNYKPPPIPESIIAEQHEMDNTARKSFEKERIISFQHACDLKRKIQTTFLQDDAAYRAGRCKFIYERHRGKFKPGDSCDRLATTNGFCREKHQGAAKKNRYNPYPPSSAPAPAPPDPPPNIQLLEAPPLPQQVAWGSNPPSFPDLPNPHKVYPISDDEDDILMNDFGAEIESESEEDVNLNPDQQPHSEAPPPNPTPAPAPDPPPDPPPDPWANEQARIEAPPLNPTPAPVSDPPRDPWANEQARIEAPPPNPTPVPVSDPPRDPWANEQARIETPPPNPTPAPSPAPSPPHLLQ